MGDRTLAAAALAAAMLSSAAVAAETAAPPAAVPQIPSWNRFVDRLRDLAPAVLAQVPEAQRSDPQVQQEVVRLMLEALASRTVDQITGDPDHPTFMASSNITMNIRQPNADTIYKRARITPGGVYRLRGHKGSLRLARIGQYVRSTTDLDVTGGLQRVKVAVYNDLNLLKTDAQGRFDVILSPERPAGYTGDWWKLDPGTTTLGIRQVAADWAKERDPTLSIERLDVPVERPRPSAADLESRLDNLGVTTKNIALQLIDRPVEMEKAGAVNKLQIMDIAGAALEGQFYYEGVYDLKDDEALIVEAKVPSRCLYHSALLTNSLYETTDWYNNHSSLNDSQTRIDSDGVLRIVVSTRDPGVPNWLDTAGHPSGVIQGRWMGCDVQPAPTARKVAFVDIRKSLPADTPTVTPAQRQAIIRERRAPSSNARSGSRLIQA